MMYNPRAALFWLRQRLYWRLRRPPGFDERIYKAAVLLTHQAETGIPVFIETGTAMGDTTERVAPWFKEVHTIEVDPVLYRNVRVKLSCYPHIRCHFGDSAIIFPSLIRSQQAIVWIDAHPPFEQAGVEPLRSELWALFRHARLRHHIFIDDADAYVRLLEEDFSGWKMWMERVGYAFELKRNIWRVLPREG